MSVRVCVYACVLHECVLLSVTESMSLSVCIKVSEQIILRLNDYIFIPNMCEDARIYESFIESMRV